MTAFLGPLRAAAPAAKLATALAALALVGAGTAMLILVPARARTAALEARLTTLRLELGRVRAAVTHLARHRVERAEMEARLEVVKEKLPAEREIPALYRSTYDTAASTGLAVSLFQPRDPRGLDSYTEIPISITAEGTYHQFGTFLERLARLTRVVTVNALKLSRLERTGVSLRAEMTLATYVYRPAVIPPAPGAPPAPLAITQRGAPARTTAPVVTAIPAGRAIAPKSVAAESLPSPQPLALAAQWPGPPGYASRGRRDPFESVSPLDVEKLPPAIPRRSAIASATLTGIVRGPQGPLALVEMPDGSGHVLRPGDGMDEARLLRIEEDAAVFEVPPRPGLVSERIILALGQAK